MRRPWGRRGDVSKLEQRLRDERPRPSDELVRRLSEESSLPRSSASHGRYSPPRLRLGLATAVSGLVLAVAIALGGLGSPLDTAKGIVQFDNAGSSKSDKGNDKDKGKPAKDQYDEKVTICHRPPGNPSNGQTLTLPRSAAEAHLRNHPDDTRGACPPPPPPKQTICHRPPGNPSNGQTLTLSQSGAEAHLRNHRLDSRGACPPPPKPKPKPKK